MIYPKYAHIEPTAPNAQPMYVQGVYETPKNVNDKESIMKKVNANIKNTANPAMS